MTARDLLHATPPTDRQSERALVAAALVDPRVFDQVTDLASDDFSDAALGRLFDSLAILRESGFPIRDIAATVPELRQMNVPSEVTSAAFLGKLVGEGLAANARFYADQVRRCSALARQRAIGLELLARTGKSDSDPAEVTRWLDGQLQSFGQRQTDESRPIGQIAAELVADLRTTQPGDRAAFSGLASHDEVVGGWMPGELVVLAARPGVGKTTFALQVAMHNAAKGRSVTFASLEMRDRELVGRVLCNRATVSGRRLRAAKLERFHLDALDRAASDVASLPLRVWSPAGVPHSQLRAISRRDQALHGLGLLVVDYIGLIRPTDARRPRHEQVAEISQSLKNIAKELSIPVLALSQLNREADGSEPRLSNLRESGAVEQDADVVLLLHPSDDGVQLICAKHRHGEVGRTGIQWSKDHLRFVDAEPARIEAFDRYNNGH